MHQDSDAAPSASGRRLQFLNVRPELRQELAATALIFAAIFVAGALLSPGAHPDAACWNAAARFGPVGSCVRATVFTLVGPVAAALAPLIPLVSAAYVAHRIERAHADALCAFIAALAVIVALAVALTIGVSAGVHALIPHAGILGALGAVGVARVIGVLGAWLVVTLALYAAARLALSIAGITMSDVLRVGLRRSVRPASRPAMRNEPPRRAIANAAPADRLEAPAQEPEPLPSSELLLPALALSNATANADREAMEFRLIGALRHLRLDATVTGRVRGPAVTRYEIEVSPSTPIADLSALGRELAASLRLGGVRVAPMPGRVGIGIELPNAATTAVSVRELIDSAEYRDAPRALPIAIGRDVGGAAVVADLAKMPHLLIAGTAGAGKSVCLSGVITSLVYRHSARSLRLLIIDTDDAGLAVYEHLPHAWGRVVTDYRAATAAIENALGEMRARIDLLAASGARNIQDFNQRVADGTYDVGKATPYMALDARPYAGGPLAHVVVVIDDLADLLRAAEGIDRPLAQLAAKARTVGIHLVAVTQRPVTDSLSRGMLSHFAARVALKVCDRAESFALIERDGAELLLGGGDMLFLPPGRSEPQRIQAPLVTPADTRRLVHWFAERAGLSIPEDDAPPVPARVEVAAEPTPAQAVLSSPTAARSSAA